MPLKNFRRGRKVPRSAERIVAASSPHPAYFMPLFAAYTLTTLLWLLLLFIIALDVSTDNLTFWRIFLVVAVVSGSAAYSLSYNYIRMHKTVLYSSYAWVILFTIALSLIALQQFHQNIVSLYPRAWWEDMFSLPFSLGTVVFALVVFMIGNIVWKLAYLAPSGIDVPLYVASVVLMFVAGVSFTIPVEILFREEIRKLLYLMLLVTMMANTGLIMSVLYHRGGMRFFVTSRRIIVKQAFLGSAKQREYPYDVIMNVTVSQGPLGCRYGYGDVTIDALTMVPTAQGLRSLRKTLLITGLRRPRTLKRTIMRLAYTARRMKRRSWLSPGGTR